MAKEIKANEKDGQPELSVLLKDVVSRKAFLQQPALQKYFRRRFYNELASSFNEARAGKVNLPFSGIVPPTKQET